MMLQVRKSHERGHFNHGWLNTYHTFSFAEYRDPAFMGFRALRVINEDSIQPSVGFPAHSHKNMEIITFILEGALEHKDSMGNGSVILPGDVQYMSAGSGVTHSEFNHSSEDVTHLIQIWILPNKLDTKPHYDQKHFELNKRPGEFHLLASGQKHDTALQIQQDVNLYALFVKPDTEVPFALNKDRYAWIQILRGSILVNGQILEAGDGMSVMQETTLLFKSQIEAAELLLFDLQ